MKERLQSFFHHSSTASRGITVLLLLLALLLLITTFTMRYFVPVSRSLKEDTALSRAWDAYKNRHTVVNMTSAGVVESTLFPFDPNTLDSFGFIKLGLRPVTTRLLLNWRRKGKVFYKKEEFKKLYTLSEQEYNRLAPYIVINARSTTSYPDYYNNRSHVYGEEPGPIDINTADSTTLVRLKGIGPYFAHKLIERREALGGYLNHGQLMEAYKFKDSTYALLKEKLIIRPQAIRKINVNTASEDQLKGHPYIGEKMAKNIILYRHAIERFEKKEQLRQVPLMNKF